jgi:hypothetical protein
MGNIVLQSSNSTYELPGTFDFQGKVKQSYTETGSTAANLANYGVSKLTAGTTGTGLNKYTLGAPEAGSVKTIYTTAAGSSDFSIVYSGSTATFFISGSTALTDALYVSLQSDGASATFLGLSTAEWLAIGEVGTVAYTTST